MYKAYCKRWLWHPNNLHRYSVFQEGSCNIQWKSSYRYLEYIAGLPSCLPYPSTDQCFPLPAQRY